MKQLFLSLDFRRGANGESERYEALFCGKWSREDDKQNKYKKGGWQGRCCNRGSRMCDDADRALRFVAKVGMVMRGKGVNRPQRQ